MKMQVDSSVIDNRLLPETYADVVSYKEPYRPISSIHLSSLYHTGPEGLRNPEIVLGDFGIALCAINGPQYGLIQPTGLRAPEVLLQAGWGRSADLWNLGVLMYEVYTGRRMYCPFVADMAGREFFNGQRWTHDIAHHLYQMEVLWGQVPYSLLGRSSLYMINRYFVPGYGLKSRVGADYVPSTSGNLELSMLKQDEQWLFLDWLRAALRMEPEHRASLDALLAHRWLAGDMGFLSEDLRARAGESEVAYASWVEASLWSDNSLVLAS